MTLAEAKPASLVRRYAVSFVVWTAVGAFLVSQRYLFSVSAGTVFNLRSSLAANFPSVWFWALMTPLVFALTQRFPLQRGAWRTNLVLHGLFSLGLAWADSALDAVLAPSIRPAAAQLSLVSWFLNKSFINVFSYAAVSATAHAIRYYELLSERKAQTTQLEKEVLQAQLHALQMQLRPHFLFNALHTVASLTRSNQSQAAIRTLAALADLLREVLKGEGAQLVPLWQEVELLEKYLRIEKVRFEDRLQTRLDVDPAALKALVPSLILQPLVENAVHHGIDSAHGSGTVDIQVSCRAEMLWLRVRNSGAGQGNERNGNGQDGIGLGNTRARLQRLYGEQHRFELRTEDNGGTVAEVGIPFQLNLAPAQEPRT